MDLVMVVRLGPGYSILQDKIHIFFFVTPVFFNEVLNVLAGWELWEKEEGI